MNSLTELIMSLTKKLSEFWCAVTKTENDFITLDKSGSARFDLAEYLNSKEGQDRIALTASDVEKEAKRMNEAA